MVNDRMEGTVGVKWRTLKVQSPVRRCRNGLGQFADETALANSWLAGKKCRLSLALAAQLPPTQQKLHFFVAAHERANPRGAAFRLEAALSFVFSHCTPDPHWA